MCSQQANICLATIERSWKLTKFISAAVIDLCDMSFIPSIASGVPTQLQWAHALTNSAINHNRLCFPRHFADGGCADHRMTINNWSQKIQHH